MGIVEHVHTRRNRRLRNRRPIQRDGGVAMISSADRAMRTIYLNSIHLMKPTVLGVLRGIALSAACICHLTAQGNEPAEVSSVIAGEGQISRSVEDRFSLAGTIGQAVADRSLRSHDRPVAESWSIGGRQEEARKKGYRTQFLCSGFRLRLQSGQRLGLMRASLYSSM